MTLTRPHRTLLNWIWQGVVLIRQVYRWNAYRLQTRKQARLLANPTIPVAATSITPLLVELPVEPSTLTSTEQETLQVSEAVSQQMVELVHPIEPVHLPDRLPPAEDSHLLESTLPTEQPAQSRSQLVMALLDEAWGQGMTTYPRLIAYVAEQTGTGCSKRVVAQWKRERKLLDEGV